MINHLLTPEWFSRLNQCDKLIVGFSGGLDSTVLLHVLASYPTLFPKLVAVHVNHGISPKSSFWKTHCEQFCQNLSVPFISHSVEFDRSANIEEGARIARYAVFSSLIKAQDGLVLGHHLDDQAETVLLQLFRGAGIDGLAAMTELSPCGLGQLARPFLHLSRKDLEQYALFYQLHWIEDESNQDEGYSRNYLRQQIVPLLKNKWPGVVSTVARTAIHCQQAKRNLDDLAVHDISLLSNPSLCIDPLLKLNGDRIANVLRVWLKNNKVQLPSTETFYRLINEVILARSDAKPLVNWGTVFIRRYQNYLYLDPKNSNDLPPCIEWSEFPSPLILEYFGQSLSAKKSSQGLVVPAGTKIFVRFRQGGEAFIWRGQTKRLKKLFQEWGVPPWLRERTPLIYFNDALAVVVGYAISDTHFTKNSPEAWDLALR